MIDGLEHNFGLSAVFRVHVHMGATHKADCSCICLQIRRLSAIYEASHVRRALSSCSKSLCMNCPQKCVQPDSM
jgi:hypothetical protein